MNEVIENNGANNVEVEEGTPAAKAEETKAGKFIRLGECRMNKAIDAGYAETKAACVEYTPEQVEAMFSTLELWVADVKAKFTVTKTRENATFSFGTKAE